MQKLPRRFRLMLTLLMVVGISMLLTSCCTLYTSPTGDKYTLGEILYRLVVGGPSISEATLLRFYAWHIAGLSIPLLILIAWHGFRVRRDGGISSPERKPDEPPLPRTDRSVI